MVEIKELFLVLVEFEGAQKVLREMLVKELLHVRHF